MIKEEYWHAEELETTEDNMLFGKHFQKKIEKKRKPNQKSIEQFLLPQRQEYRHRQPFPKAPPTSTSFGEGARVGRFVQGVDNRGNANRGKTFSSKIVSVKQTNPKVIKGIKSSRTPVYLRTTRVPRTKISIPRVIFAGRPRYFVNEWKKITSDREILNIVGKYPYKRPHYKKKR